MRIELDKSWFERNISNDNQEISAGITSTIEAIKSKLVYSNKQEQEAAYASWFTVIAVLADAYADEGMTKEETICRWIIREGKIPERSPTGEYWWWDKGIVKAEKESSVIPFLWGEIFNLGLELAEPLNRCLDRVISIPDQYLDRFELKGELSGSI